MTAIKGKATFASGGQAKAIIERTAQKVPEPKGVKKRGNPAFVKGVSGNPAGKPKGTAHTHSLKAARKAAQDYDILPLDFFMTELNNVANPKPWRNDCAKAAAPYVHRKMPIGIDNGAGGPVSFVTPEQLAQLPAKDLKALEEIMSKVAALTTPGIMVAAATTAAVESQGDEE